MQSNECVQNQHIFMIKENEDQLKPKSKIYFSAKSTELTHKPNRTIIFFSARMKGKCNGINVSQRLKATCLGSWNDRKIGSSE